MNHLDPQTKLWIVFGLISAATGLLAELCIRGILYVTTRLKPLAFLPDEEGGVGFHGRVKMSDGHIVIGRGDAEKRYPVAAQSRQMTNDGAIYVLGRRTGTNLSVPTVDEIEATLATPNEIVSFNVHDPTLLGRVFAKRMAQETVEGQMERDDWKKTAVLPLAIVAGLAIVGLVVAVLKFAPGGG